MSIGEWTGNEMDILFIGNGILFILKKERNPAICNMDGTGEHYAKWRKAGTEWQILLDTTYMKNLKMSNS